jgi:hypothetical protein
VGEDLRGGALNNMVMGKNNVLLMYARNNDVTLAQYLLDNVTGALAAVQFART